MMLSHLHSKELSCSLHPWRRCCAWGAEVPDVLNIGHMWPDRVVICGYVALDAYHYDKVGTSYGSGDHPTHELHCLMELQFLGQVAGQSHAHRWTVTWIAGQSHDATSISEAESGMHRVRVHGIWSI